MYLGLEDLWGCVLSPVGKSKGLRGEHFSSTDVLLEEPESPQLARGKVQLINVKKTLWFGNWFGVLWCVCTLSMCAYHWWLRITGAIFVERHLNSYEETLRIWELGISLENKQKKCSIYRINLVNLKDCFRLQMGKMSWVWWAYVWVQELDLTQAIAAIDFFVVFEFRFGFEDCQVLSNCIKY